MHATQVSAEAVGAHRVGVWLFGGRKGALGCFAQYDGAARSHGTAESIDLQRCPAYLAAIDARRVLVVDDVSLHPATREIGPLHLASQGVGALLDAPILRGGRVTGVVRHEHLGGPRRWSQRDVDFASSVADMIALIFEQSERLELEAALHEQAEQRQESQKMEALGRMASAIVHDFNNVLGSIGMATQLAASDRTDMPTLAARLRQIVDTAQRLNDQLLSFARSEPDPAGASCELGLVIEESLAMLRAAASSRAIVSYQAPPSGMVAAIGRSQAEQLLLNLVLNSRDAIGARGTIHLVLREAGAQDEGPPQSIVLSVSDNGAGMDEATRSRALEPYFTTKARGTGLGLSTVFAIVRAAGGTLRLESEPGVGTTVTLLLPRLESGE